ncbi:phosphotransferase [Candidatus Falkowbacteria bacterium]|nr:phosphotransferase [Candidatus Falkowbacteria bacterium]
MNIIHQLFDIDFVKQLFKEKILPKYPDFTAIKKIDIKPRKDHIWDQTYHVVIEYKTQFIDKEGKVKKLPIFCSAHSCEPRKNLYRALRFLWDNGFGRSHLTVPHPLYYSQKFKATFYRGAKGRNFYYYIRENRYNDIEKTIPQIAAWFAKLHKTPNRGIGNFNKRNSRIRTAIPGRDHILRDIEIKHPHYYAIYKNLYNKFIRQEEEFLKSTDKRWLVHGDAHPENVIKVGEKKLSVIDFNDLCLSDCARDVGCFLQQFGYMSDRKIEDKVFVERMKQLFLDSYLRYMGFEYTDSFQARVQNYSDWTALRTATFFLLKNDPNPDRAAYLIDQLINI